MVSSTKHFATPLQYLCGPPGGRGPPVEDLCTRALASGQQATAYNHLHSCPPASLVWETVLRICPCLAISCTIRPRYICF